MHTTGSHRTPSVSSGAGQWPPAVIFFLSTRANVPFARLVHGKIFLVS